MPSKNLIGKEYIRTQAFMTKLIYLIKLFLTFLVTLFHMKQLHVMTKILDLIYCLQCLQERLSTSIESFKKSYYARIVNGLNNTQKSTKTYWSLLKSF